MVTSKERVEAVLLHKKTDHVPFTVYEPMVPHCETERRLRNEGLCIVKRVGVVKTKTPDVKETVCNYHENGMQKARRDIQTPHGNLCSIRVIVPMDAPPGSTSWIKQHIFKKQEDYKPIEFMIRNRVHTADYEPFLRAQKMTGGDAVCRAQGLGSQPFHDIMHSIMGIETFAVEWAENRDEVLKLYNALVEDSRKRYTIVAQSPALHANYGGNIISEMVGFERFEKYILPNYQECAEIMHKHGKLVGSHLDGNNKLIAPLVAKSGLDYIEAFTPSPDSDMTVKEALDIWQDKILWINFPSSVHLREPEDIKNTLLDILEQSKPGYRLIVGVTENVPHSCWQKSFSVISDTLNTCGKLPLS